MSPKYSKPRTAPPGGRNRSTVRVRWPRRANLASIENRDVSDRIGYSTNTSISPWLRTNAKRDARDRRRQNRGLHNAAYCILPAGGTKRCESVCCSAGLQPCAQAGLKACTTSDLGGENRYAHAKCSHRYDVPDRHRLAQ